MINHRIFSKGDIVYCLLSSAKEPNILIPMKGLIIDIKWDEYNPKYLVKFHKFFDNYNFIKRYFFNMSFYNKFDDPTHPVIFNKRDFKTVKEFSAYLIEKKWVVVIDSIMCVKTKANLQILFNKIQYALISEFYKLLRYLTTRELYSGILRIDSQLEYDIRLKQMIGDKFEKPDAEMTFEKWLTLLKRVT